MSEPSDTGGRPLTRNTKQEKQPEGSTIDTSSSTHITLHRSSPPLDDFSKVIESKSPPRCPRTTTKTPSDPHVGPSRPKQLSRSSLASMMSRSPSINYTRTGRISKAKKGLKVHNCECGRVSYMHPSPWRQKEMNMASGTCSLDTTTWRDDVQSAGSAMPSLLSVLQANDLTGSNRSADDS
jgi:hypothetical protein